MENAGLDLFEAMSTLRSVRRLRPDPIPEDVLKKVLTAATWAPNGGNRQGWRFIVVRDPEKKKALRDLYLPHLAITDAKLGRPSIVGGGSIYPAVHNLMLACRSFGLGATLTTLLCMSEPQVRELLSIPNDYATAAYVPIGYPQGKGFGPLSRKPV